MIDLVDAIKSDFYMNMAESSTNGPTVNILGAPSTWSTQFSVEAPAVACPTVTTNYQSLNPTLASVANNRTDGPYKICVKFVVDGQVYYGNSSVFQLDRAAPTISTQSSVTGTSGSTSLMATVGGASRYEWRTASLSGQLTFSPVKGDLPPGTPTSTISTSVAAPTSAGTYTAELHVFDAAGNETVRSISITWATVSNSAVSDVYANRLKLVYGGNILPKNTCIGVDLMPADASSQAVTVTTALNVSIRADGAELFTAASCSGVGASELTLSLATSTQIYVKTPMASSEVFLFARDTAVGTTVNPALFYGIVGSRLYAAANRTCMVGESGGVGCWGENNYGQIGDGTTSNKSTPVSPSSLGTSIRQLALGSNHSCALLTDYSVKCWGRNEFGQLGLQPVVGGSPTAGTVASSSSPISVGFTFLNGRSPRYLVAGERHNCAIMDDMSVQCWGANDYGQLGNGTQTSSYSPVLVSGSGRYRLVSAGGNHNCGVVPGNPTVIKCWGRNDYGQIGNGAPETAPAPQTTPIAVNVDSTTGNLLISGYEPVRLSLGENHSCAVARIPNGTGGFSSPALYCWGSYLNGSASANSKDSSSPTLTNLNLSTGAMMNNIILGSRHSCGLDGGGKLYCWGQNSHGQLGINSTTSTSPGSAAAVLTLTAPQFAAGRAHTCALSPTFSNSPTTVAFKCWGDSASGQLGVSGLTLDVLQP